MHGGLISIGIHFGLVYGGLIHIRSLIFVNIFDSEQSIWMMSCRPNVYISLHTSSGKILVLKLLKRAYLDYS